MLLDLALVVVDAVGHPGSPARRTVAALLVAKLELEEGKKRRAGGGGRSLRLHTALTQAHVVPPQDDGLTLVHEGAEAAVRILLDRLPVLGEDLVEGDDHIALAFDYLRDIHQLPQAQAAHVLRHDPVSLLFDLVAGQARGRLVVHEVPTRDRGGLGGEDADGGAQGDAERKLTRRLGERLGGGGTLQTTLKSTKKVVV